MNFIFTSRKCEVDQTTKDRTAKKLSKLNKFFKNDCEVLVIFLGQKHSLYGVEVTIDYKGLVFRAEQEAQDIFSAVDQIIDTLVRQIIKNKTRLEKRVHSSSNDLPSELLSDNHSEEEYQIIKNKKFYVKPMDVEEAILQMNMLNHEFFAFLDAAGEKVNIVYRRKDGNYGLIEPIWG